MKESLLDNVRVNLRRSNRKQVSRETGISTNTLHKISNNPDYRPVKSVTSHLGLYYGINADECSE
jgi:DNA-binding Xre family transcriptional regulator